MSANDERQTWGPYHGFIDEAFLGIPAFTVKLPAFGSDLLHAEMQGRPGRNNHYRMTVGEGSDRLGLSVKSFGRHVFMKDLVDRRIGSKAERSWRIARVLQQHGVGTPRPVGFLDRWDGPRLRESYLLTCYQAGLSDFRRELIHLYRHDPQASRVVALLALVAGAVRAMHESGVMHRDLGNQNILLRRTEDGWADVQFIDLNRARHFGGLSLRRRARDLSRIHLPSDLLRIFQEMYWRGRPTRDFVRWERHYRKAYARHARTRHLRHPLRTRQRRGQDGPEITYPDAREIWLWDERTSQPINVVRRRERNRIRSKRNHARTALATLAVGPGLYRRYRDTLAACYTRRVELAGRIGVAVDPGPGDEERECDLLGELGALPTLVRFYRHGGEEHWAQRIQLVRALHERGHPITVALVQDRTAVREPERWTAFLETVLPPVQDLVEGVELGHAINRVKWGCWNLEEYGRLLAAGVEVVRKLPGLKVMGPACIDFEYQHLAAALAQQPADFRYHALSHHLYVDRRGAPENRQGRFSALEKLALARAMASHAKGCEDRLIISEVNWPLLEGGVYSPIGSPYLYPGQQLARPPSVTEDEYADYMLRYLLIAICSGLVERVFWWKLVHRGYGLVDDTHAAHWRRRPAFDVLQAFLAEVGDGAFVGQREAPPGSAFFEFELPGGRRTVVAYSAHEARRIKPAFGCDAVRNAKGRRIAVTGQAVTLAGRPIYLEGVRERI